MPETLHIVAFTHHEKTDDPDHPIVDICDRVLVHGKEIEIPAGCSVSFSKTTKTLRKDTQG